MRLNLLNKRLPINLAGRLSGHQVSPFLINKMVRSKLTVGLVWLQLFAAVACFADDKVIEDGGGLPPAVDKNFDLLAPKESTVEEWSVFRDGILLNAPDVTSNAGKLTFARALPGKYVVYLRYVDKEGNTRRVVRTFDLGTVANPASQIGGIGPLLDRPETGGLQLPGRSSSQQPEARKEKLALRAAELLNQTKVRYDVRQEETASALVAAAHPILVRNPPYQNAAEFEAALINAWQPIIEKVPGRGPQYWKEYFESYIDHEMRTLGYKYDDLKDMHEAWSAVVEGLGKAPQKKEELRKMVAEYLVNSGFDPGTLGGGTGSGGSTRHRCRGLFRRR